MNVAEFGPKLRALRKARGLTQKAVAELCGVTVITISNWEVGRAAPWPKNQEAMLKAVAPPSAPVQPAALAEPLAAPSFALPPRRARLVDNV